MPLGAGTGVRAIEAATKRTPIVTGKPSMLLMDVIKSRFEVWFTLTLAIFLFNLPSKRIELDLLRTIMIGDRY